jgi:hypothetical protein
VLLPALTAHDPAASGEGSRDPLGLEASAERLASLYLPAVTSRMSRIRALTVLALSAQVCHPMLDEYTADESAPSWLVFEWIWAEATATGRSDTRGIPGIDTTRRRLHNGERISSRNYLKGATALGLHGFYRTLAEDTLVLDRNGFLDENGERLLSAWAADQGFKGLLDDSGEGRRLVRFLREAVRRSMDVSACAAPPTGEAIWRLRQHAAPEFNGACQRERSELRALLIADERRQGMLSILAEPSVSAHADDAVAHIDAAAKEADRRDDDPYPEIAAALKALIGFERFGSAVTTAFDLMRHRSTKLLRQPTEITRLGDDRHDAILAGLPALVQACDAAFAPVPPDPSRASAVDAFRALKSVPDLLDAAIARHIAVQRSKGSRGKLPWFEPGPQLAVRGPYTLADPPPWGERLLHPTRLPNATSFLQELG